VKPRFWLSALTAALLGVSAVSTLQAQEKRLPANFGALEAASEEAVKAKALAWFKAAGHTDAIKLQAFENIWRDSERPVVDRLAESFALGDPAAAKLLNDARDITVAAPTEIPAILRDAKLPAFYRANLGLAYARSLSNRRVHEEALEVLKGFKAEDVIDPNAYLFHRAISEHAMLMKGDAGKTITRLLQDAVDSPERYRTVGALMLLDMQTWKSDKDLPAIARKMSDVERRLELARGGPQTQKVQKEIIARLDELIKELENKAKNSSQSNGGSCPNGGEPKPGNGGGATPSAPMQDSNIATNGGTGRVDQAKLRKLAEGWGKMTENQRAAALQEVANLTANLSLTHQEQYRDYFRRLAELEVAKGNR